jgi:hypothetical protein
MKIQLRPRESGSILIITIMTAGIIGFTLMAYLSLVEQQNLSVMRSMTWNSGIPAAEAAIEEAMAHLNSIGDGDRSSNGWSANLDTGLFQMKREIGDARYEVGISADWAPIITATGYSKAPITAKEISRTVRVTTSRNSTGMKGLVAKGAVELTGNILLDSFDSEDPIFSTDGRYDPKKTKDNGYVGSVLDSIIGGGALVHGKVGTGPDGKADEAGTVGDDDWFGGGFTGIQTGHYANDLNVSFPDVTLPDMTDVQTPGSATVTVTNYTWLTNASISLTFPSSYTGDVVTNNGPVTTIDYPSGFIGTVTTNIAAMTGQSDYPADGTYWPPVTTNTSVQKVKGVSTTVITYDYQHITGYTYTTTSYSYSVVMTNITTSTDTYAYVLDNGNYQISSISMSGVAGPGSTMLVRGNAVLYIEGTFAMAGNAQVLIQPGASLTIYAGSTVDLKGNGIDNGTMDASKFNLKGLPTCTSIDYGGNASFTGVIYAPQADLHLGGGGKDVFDVVGAAVVGKAKLNGHFNFHYDEMLGRKGGNEL